MNKPQILYCVQNGKAEHLQLLGDFPGRPNCLLYKSQEDGDLVTVYQDDIEQEKHMYFTDRNEALFQCIKWHQNEITKLEHIINEQVPTKS